MPSPVGSRVVASPCLARGVSAWPSYKILIRGLGPSLTSGDWRPAAWLLERAFPAEFSGRHEEGKRGADGLPAGTVTPIVHVTVHHDEASDAARKRFGTPPPNRSRTATLRCPTDPIPISV